MRIVALDLENIKSYRQAHIDFTEGLNAVCGLNGSGKTTVVEAIGFALFDYLPYSQTHFLREGAKNGTIRVRLLAADDREYEVVRKIGSGSSYHVADLETGTKLAERGENVLDWMATHALGIDGGADLPSLFKNAVGVPQGLMTADFQRTAVQRKSVFDPLLRVEEYRNAYETLRETVSYLKDLSAGIKEEAARLEGETEGIPARREEQSVLLTELRQSESRLVELEGVLSHAGQQRAELDEIEATVSRLELELSHKAQDVRGHEARLEEQEKRVHSARNARRAVAEAEPGYEKVTAAREQLAALEEQRRARDALREDLNDANKSWHGIKGHIESLDTQLRQARDAGTEAAGLVEVVARQDELERQLQEALLRSEGARKLDEQLAKVRREIEDLERSAVDRATRLAEARRARGEAERLGEAEEKLRQVGEHLAAVDLFKTQLQDVQTEGKRLRRQHDALTNEVQRRHALLQQAAEKEREGGDLEALTHREQELREERARLHAAIEYHSVARADLSRHHCPLLEVVCPVVSSDVTMVERLDDRAETSAARARELDTELASLSARLDAMKVAAAELQTLRLQAAQLEQSEPQAAEVEAALERCRNQFQELSRTVSTEPKLREEQRTLRQEVTGLRAAEKVAAQVGVLEEQEVELRGRLAVQRQELETLESQRAQLRAVEEQVQTLTAELEGLGNPRRQQQDKLAIAQRQPGLESDLQQQQIELNREGDRLKILTAEIQRYEHLDQEIEEQRRVEREFDADFKRYLDNRKEAQEVEAREAALAETISALEGARDSALAVECQLAETRARYDAERHRTLKEMCEELGKELSAEQAHLTHLAQRLKVTEEDLAYLRRQEEKLLACRAELSELEGVNKAVTFIRETIKSAGPAITETLLANISQTANDIYAEIMDDHAAELRWDRDYEVVVQRGAEERTFSLLSGGEQMSAALAVRLALLKEMSEVDFAFFDEPTQNMDGERRSNLAEQIRAVRGFEQLIVISHDDTFEQYTDNLIRLRKVHEETELEAGQPVPDR